MKLGFLAFTLTSALSAADSTDQVFAAIRSNDLATVRRYAADADTREARGKNDVTPLIYAASFGSTDAVKILLDAGASVNLQDARGASAVLYGAWDLARTRLLIAKGAELNIESKQRQTPLLVAIKVFGNEATTKALLDAGAKPSGQALINAAIYQPEIAKLLVGKGVDVNSTNPPGFTALQFAASGRNLELVKFLLANGATVDKANVSSNKVRHGEIALKKLTPLMLAVPDGSPAVVNALLKAGANVNLRDVRGMTALMLAVACDSAKPEIVNALLASGADVNVTSEAGETALDWARKFGNPAIIRMLEKDGTAPARQAAAIAEAAPAADAKVALARSVPLIQNSATTFFRESGCPACHNVSTSGLALGPVRAARLAYDDKAAVEMAKSVVATVAPLAPALLQRVDIGGQSDTATFMLTGLQGYGHAPDVTSDSFVAYLAGFQNSQGNWGGPLASGVSRAPMEDTDTGRTAFAVRALKMYGWSARQPEFESRIARARSWLLEARPVTSYALAEQLLGLKWSGATQAQISKVSKALVAQQRADGGWSQNSYLASDAYATGLALWALHESGTARASDASYRKGAAFLLRTQRADGSWFVASRSPKFQPYFEGGFPYGHDQWISNAATAYATMALAPLAESTQLAAR